MAKMKARAKAKLQMKMKKQRLAGGHLIAEVGIEEGSGEEGRRRQEIKGNEKMNSHECS
jgi:hypothetical protein